MNTRCALCIPVAVTDVTFMMHTIPHLVRACRYPFMKKVLMVETAPLSGEKKQRPHIGAMEELVKKCDELKDRGVIDDFFLLDYSKKLQRNIYRKHFGFSSLKATHNWKGYPIFGSMVAIEDCPADYFLHFDADMLLFQNANSDWISQGIKILEADEDVLWVSPQTGPGNFAHPQYRNSDLKTEMFFRMNNFSSRVYLINRKRFERLLPLRILWAKQQGRIKDLIPRGVVDAWHRLTGGGILESWEVMVGEAMKEKKMYRADVADPNVWTLHPPKHDSEFISRLPKLIENIEAGYFPEAQAGKYDLDLSVWFASGKTDCV